MSVNVRIPNEDQNSSSLTPLLKSENPNAPSNVNSREDNRLVTASSNQTSLYPPACGVLRPSYGTPSRNPDEVEEHGSGTPRLFRSVKHAPKPNKESPTSPNKWVNLKQVFWKRNRGSILVIVAMFFGALMSLTTQLLETNHRNGQAMHPFQILFTRMGITSILCTVYMLYHNIAPLGTKGIRWLLVARGISGFVGVLGLYYSLLYLTVADATVICFLAPLVSCLAYSFLLHEPVTITEKLTGLVSFFGVVVIARPPFIFGAASSTSYTSLTNYSSMSDVVMSHNFNSAPSHKFGTGSVAPAQRISAIIIGLIGVGGAAVAYISIRLIGHRAHSLVSVNYLSVLSTVVSAICLLSIPTIGFRLPANVREWTYLSSLGVCGFIMQFLVTKGLQDDKAGSRATNMVYTQLLFALAFDYLFLDKTPALTSIVGSILILGSVLYMALHVKEAQVRDEDEIGADEEPIVESTYAPEEDPGASAIPSGTYTRIVENHEATSAV